MDAIRCPWTEGLIFSCHASEQCRLAWERDEGYNMIRTPYYYAACSPKCQARCWKKYTDSGRGE